MKRKPAKYGCGGKVIKSYQDGGKVKSYGAPLSTPPPGQTTRQRPKVGDKSSDTSRLNPKQRTPSKPPAAPKKGNEGSTFRDYRGVDGVVEDAVKGKKDGGTVKKKKPPMKPPEKGGKPKRITTPGKPGDTGPWGATPARDRQKRKRK